MICEKCKQNPASQFIEMLCDGVLEEVYVCSNCAANQPKEKFFDQDKAALVCTCGTSFEEIRESGYVGCLKCYQTFAEQLQPIIFAIHGHNFHRGKLPLGKKERLQMQIEQALKNGFVDLAKKLQTQLDKEVGK